ncbi:hypothetical protein NJBCHELONAE_48750 [Mycobacteroides chelonae]|uniref:hypothetical protein n=1 Tax=Mycobacteroides chelonae TaxID=1774 RepID=UPI0021DB8309|nr:hypothetical protein [Mycobacteroides chelonae]GLE59562.1 hypothetical protein NJBCHELONAE_48750 [Mycobacteroides chelonae]
MKIEHEYGANGVSRTLVNGQRVAGSLESSTRRGMTRVFTHSNDTDYFYVFSEDVTAARNVIADAYVAGFKAAETKHEAEQQRLTTLPEDPIIIPLITEKRVRELIAEGHNDLLESLGQLAQGVADLIGGLK